MHCGLPVSRGIREDYSLLDILYRGCLRSSRFADSSVYKEVPMVSHYVTSRLLSLMWSLVASGPHGSSLTVAATATLLKSSFPKLPDALSFAVQYEMQNFTARRSWDLMEGAASEESARNLQERKLLGQKPALRLQKLENISVQRLLWLARDSAAGKCDAVRCSAVQCSALRRIVRYGLPRRSLFRGWLVSPSLKALLHQMFGLCLLLLTSSLRFRDHVCFCRNTVSSTPHGLPSGSLLPGFGLLYYVNVRRSLMLATADGPIQGNIKSLLMSKCKQNVLLSYFAALAVGNLPCGAKDASDSSCHQGGGASRLTPMLIYILDQATVFQTREIEIEETLVKRD